MNIFTKHPNEVDMTYWEHLRFALVLTLVFTLMTLISVIHAVFPFFFTDTISRGIKILNEELTETRN